MILDKCSYISVIEEILNGNCKFSKLNIPGGKDINHIVNFEKRITSQLKLWKGKEIIDKSTYKSIKPVGSRPVILCGLGKVHKKTGSGIPPSRPNFFSYSYIYIQISKVFIEVFNTFNI